MTTCAAGFPINAPSALPPRRRLFRLVGAGLFLFFGVVWAGRDTLELRACTPTQLWVLAVVAALFCITPLRRGLLALMAAARDPSPRARRFITLSVFVLSAAYLFADALFQHRDFFPKYHDEFMHLTEAQLLAHGRLWLPQHPLADFFETFHVLVKPVYCGIHFPGVALLYALPVLLHAPFWMMPLLIAAAAAALLYRIAAQLLDGWSGLLAAVLLLSLQQLRFVSLMVMSNPLTLTLGLGMVWAFLHWRERRGMKWAFVLGVLAGWCAITRPPDAICFAVPIGIAMLWELSCPLSPVLRGEGWGEGWNDEPRNVRPSSPDPSPQPSPLSTRERGQERSFPNRLRTAAMLFAGAIPFLALQIVFDLGVTGKPFLTPYSVYADAFNPGVNYGFRAHDPAARPASELAQKQEYYTRFVLPNLENHTLEKALPVALHIRLPLTFKSTLPAMALLALLPAGVAWAIRSRWTWVLAAVLPLYFLVYFFQAMIAPFYPLFAAPAAIVLVLAGARRMETAVAAVWPKTRSVVSCGLTLFIVALAAAATPEVQGQPTEQFSMPTRVAIRDALSHIQTPAIVLFRFRPSDNLHEEPVYNIDTANPDDAAIVHAQDLGPRNIELFRYYARIQPTRRVYLFDRREKTIEDLGIVKDLAAGQDIR